MYATIKSAWGFKSENNNKNKKQIKIKNKKIKKLKVLKKN
jgi:hypothetical protein